MLVVVAAAVLVAAKRSPLISTPTAHSLHIKFQVYDWYECSMARSTSSTGSPDNRGTSVLFDFLNTTS